MGAPLLLRAEQVAAGGDAIAREPSGRVVFVAGALPGELVLARLTKEKKDYARATVDEVVEPSPDRVEPPCRHEHEGCGGCSWQHVLPVAQTGLKVDVVREALRRTGGLGEAAVVTGPRLAPWGFRTSLRMAVMSDGRLAFRGRRSHNLVGVEDCLLAHPSLAGLVP
ncbi:MAG TPA: TRAM domain-containing protein, partial [Acidimicrobiales bacterium]